MLKAPTYIIALIALIVVSSTSKAQQKEHPGMILFKQGKYEDAIYPLSLAVESNVHKHDPEIWNALGLSYFYKGDHEKSVKALSQAIKIKPGDTNFHSDLARAYLELPDLKKAENEASTAIEIDSSNTTAYFTRATSFLLGGELPKAETDTIQLRAIDPGFGQAYLLASKIQMEILATEIRKEGGKVDAIRKNVNILARSKAILSEGIEKSRSGDEKKQIENELVSVTALYDFFSKPEPSDVGSVIPLRILSVPKASYTERARVKNVNGMIRLAILFGASGKVEGIIVLKRLHPDLDQNSVAAATQLKFEPKMIDGKPVTAVSIVSYSFSIY